MDILKQIEDHREKIAALEKELVNQRRNKLVNLHKELGYDSRQDLINDLKALRGGGGARSGKRMVITDELRARIEEGLRSGRGSTEIARETGVSVPTVQNIKKKIGLVKSN